MRARPCPPMLFAFLGCACDGAWKADDLPLTLDDGPGIVAVERNTAASGELWYDATGYDAEVQWSVVENDDVVCDSDLIWSGGRLPAGTEAEYICEDCTWMARSGVRLI